MLQARLVDRDAVDHRVRAREVDELEDARIQRRVRRALPAVEVAVLVDEDRLARRHVAHQAEAERVERDALGGDQVLDAAARFRCGRSRAGGCRTDRGTRAGRSRRSSPPPRTRRGTRRCTPATAAKMVVGIELVAGRRVLQLVREHVEQHFRIGVGVDVPPVLPEHLAP